MKTTLKKDDLTNEENIKNDLKNEDAVKIKRTSDTSLKVVGAHPPATKHRLQNAKWPPRGPNWPTGSGNRSTLQILGTPITFCLTLIIPWEGGGA